MAVDLAKAIATCEELLARLRDLDGSSPDPSQSRAGRRERTAVNRALLYSAHLADRASVEIMGEYHAARARDDSGGEP